MSDNDHIDTEAAHRKQWASEYEQSEARTEAAKVAVGMRARAVEAHIGVLPLAEPAMRRDVDEVQQSDGSYGYRYSLQLEHLSERQMLAVLDALQDTLPRDRKSV